jgi:hypothetical protein
LFFLSADSGGMGKDQRPLVVGAIRYDWTGNGSDESSTNWRTKTWVRWDAFSDSAVQDCQRR